MEDWAVAINSANQEAILRLMEGSVFSSRWILANCGEVPFFHFTDIAGGPGCEKLQNQKFTGLNPARATSRSCRQPAAEPDIN